MVWPLSHALLKAGEAQRSRQDAELKAQVESHKAMLDKMTEDAKISLQQWKTAQDNATKIEVAEIAAAATLQGAQIGAAKAAESPP